MNLQEKEKLEQQLIFCATQLDFMLGCITEEVSQGFDSHKKKFEMKHA